MTSPRTGISVLCSGMSMLYQISKLLSVCATTTSLCITHWTNNAFSNSNCFSPVGISTKYNLTKHKRNVISNFDDNNNGTESNSPHFLIAKEKFLARFVQFDPVNFGIMIYLGNDRFLYQIHYADGLHVKQVGQFFVVSKMAMFLFSP